MSGILLVVSRLHWQSRVGPSPFFPRQLLADASSACMDCDYQWRSVSTCACYPLFALLVAQTQLCSQVAQAWLGGGGHPEAMSESSGSEYEPQEVEMVSSEEIEGSESSEVSEVQQEDEVSEDDEDEDTDMSDMDGLGEPRGTKGRNR